MSAKRFTERRSTTASDRAVLHPTSCGHGGMLPGRSLVETVAVFVRGSDDFQPL